ncbi:uncharacterized protein TNCT_701011, partial [Trichonephila clavata]
MNTIFPIRNRNITFVYDERLKTVVKCQSTNLHISGRSEPKTSYLRFSEVKYKVFRILLNLEKEELFYPWLTHQVFFAIHSPFVPINPFTDGRALKSGYRYNINIKLEEDHLLPHPYQTNCTDYEAMWKRNNKTGPRSQQTCRDICRKNISKECYGCEKFMTMLEDSEKLCSPLEGWELSPPIKCKKKFMKRLRNMMKCIDDCKEEC